MYFDPKDRETNTSRGFADLFQLSNGRLSKNFNLDDMQGKVTACIKEYASKFAQDCTLDDQIIVRVMRHFLDSKKYQKFWVPKKENKKTDKQEDDGLVRKMMKNLLSLNHTHYPSYLRNKIRSHYFDNESEAKAERLLELFQELETSHKDGNEDSIDDGKDGNDNRDVSKKEDIFFS